MYQQFRNQEQQHPTLTTILSPILLPLLARPASLVTGRDFRSFRPANAALPAQRNTQTRPRAAYYASKKAPPRPSHPLGQKPTTHA